MELSNVLLIDNTKNTKKIILLQKYELLKNVTIDLVTNKKEILNSLEEEEYSIVLINFNLEWYPIQDLIELVSQKYPFSGLIVFSFQQVSQKINGKKLKIDSVINNFDVQTQNIEFAFEFALERASERRDLYKLNRDYKELFDNVPIGLYRTDFRGRIIACNNTFAKILGYDKEQEIEGLRIQNFYAESTKEESLLTKIFSSFPYTNGVRKLKRKDGSIIWVDIDTKSTLVNNVLIYLNGTVKDITESRKTQILLQKKEESYQKLLQTTPDAIILIDLEGKIQFVNQQFLKIFRFNNEEEIIGENFLQLINNSSYGIISEACQYTNEEKKKTSYEIELIRKDGEIFPAEVNINSIKDEKKEPYAIIAIARDISEKKVSIEKIKKSEEKYRQLFNKANDAIVLMELTDQKLPGDFIEINDVACLRYGYNREEMLKMNIQSILAPQAKENVPNVIRTLENEGLITFETLHITRNGREIPTEICSHLFTLDDKKLILSIMRDITDRKKAEILLRNSEEMYRLIFENTGSSMIVTNDNYEIKVCNTNFEKLINRSKKEIEGKSWKSLIYENDLEKLIKLSNDLKNNPELCPQEIEFRLVGDNGSIKTVWGIINMIPKKREAVVSIYDITEKTLMEEVKRQAFDQIDRNLEQFAIIVDSIRNPLAVIVALADVQNNELSRRIVEQAELIDRILLRLDERSLESTNVRNFIHTHAP
ncbi:MAG: PAS domain S-box protein [Candidatus Heimdallarchaeota archaeon]|nr:PAS domain S-box protein [Candidatus Heimdallarchaeota archaeon]